MTFWLADWLRAFGITLAVELAVALPLLAAVEPRIVRRVAGVALLNLATHPLVWFVTPALRLPYPVSLGLAEVWAFAIELGAYAVIWPAAGPRRCALISLVANTASVLAGLVLR